MTICKIYILVVRERNCMSTKRKQELDARVTLTRPPGAQNFKIVLPFFYDSSLSDC